MEEVEAFVRHELFDPGRTEAVVALTTRSGEPEPLIPPARLAQELAGKARVVVIPTGVVTWRLTAELPERLGVYGGAVRVWMPGLAPGADPFVHPLLMVFMPEDVARVIARIRSILGLPEPEREPVPALVADGSPSLPPAEQGSPREVELERECRDLARDREELLQRAEKLHDELKKVRLEVQELRKRLRSAGASAASAPADDPTSSPARFLAAVCEAYAALYPPADARQFPLKMLRVGPKFLDSVKALETVDVARIVEICAHVAAGRAHEIPGLHAHPLRSGSRGAPNRVRARDGAQAWRCALKVNAPSAGRLHWWVLQGVEGGALEFASVGLHDDVDIPE
ncbi:MAG TPA: hypothetical protein VFG37_07495 [Planctomycetota bacterium]|nr:hypothetical protein [Planctomycetota bacterium]